MDLKVIGFFSGSGETGTTMTALSFAEELAETGRRTLFIYGSGKKGNLYSTVENMKGLDCIRAELLCGVPEREEIEEILNKQGKLYIIGGTDSSYEARLFPLETFEGILPVLEMLGFEFVIIDGGNRFELAMTVSAINVSDEIFFVLTQQMKSVLRFKDTDEKVLRPLGLKLRIVLNRYKRDIALLSASDIENITGRKVQFTIGEMSSSWQKEVQGKTLRDRRKYRKEVKQIAEKVLSEGEPSK